MKKSILLRKCLICGKRLRITLYPDRYYRGGHYFNKLKIPIGKGKYKKVGIFKFGGRSYPVVKWTGNERKVEYWECDHCYHDGKNEEWLKKPSNEFIASDVKMPHAAVGVVQRGTSTTQFSHIAKANCNSRKLFIATGYGQDHVCPRQRHE